MEFYYFCIIVLLTSHSLEVDCATKNSAVYALVYKDIGASSFDKCIRVLNGTKQIGCQSEMNGNVGVLLLLNSSSDIDQVTNGRHGPYIILLNAAILSGDFVKNLQDTRNVNGILVFADDGYAGQSNGFSPEPQCPRYIYGLYTSTYGSKYAKCENNPWNIPGNDLSYIDIEFPVFYMQNSTATKEILTCYNENNRDGDYPFCAAQMDARMDAAVSTETCMRRNVLQNNLSPASYCQAMGKKNIISMLQQPNVGDNRPIILVTAALDSRSFLLSSAVPGANSATGFITLLSVANVLGELSKEAKENMSHRVVFVLFDGEAFDNSASIRMVYDMENNRCPYSPKSGTVQPETIDLAQVEFVIELGQLGYVRDRAWIYFDPVSKDGNTSRLVNTIKDQSLGSTVSFDAPSADIGLPPSSLHSMLKKRNVTGVLITDFDQNYTNKYYLSAYDTVDKLGIPLNVSRTEKETIVALHQLATKMSEMSNVISRAVYTLSTGKNMSNPSSDPSAIANTLYCYLINSSCSFFRKFVDSGNTNNFKSDGRPLNRYVSVYSATQLTASEYFARNMLLWYTGDQVNVTGTSNGCKAPSNDMRYSYLAFDRNTSNICVRAPIYLADGRSPAVLISNYDYANGPYPAWSESIWPRDAFKLSIFVVQNPVSQGMVLLCGLVILIFSIFIVVFVSKNSDILFSIGDGL